jgi:hypothetical protein
MTGGGYYMASAHKPTAVTHSVLGRFTAANDLNLAICKSNQIQIYMVTPEGLKFLKHVGILGIVDNMTLIRLKVTSQKQTKFRFLATYWTYTLPIRTTRKIAC